MNLGTVQIIQGNALALPLPDDSVDLVCTSPPYFGLRSYQDSCASCGGVDPSGPKMSGPSAKSTLTGSKANRSGTDRDGQTPDPTCVDCGGTGKGHYDGQIGSEPTPAEFLDALLAATREMVRVLKPSGSIFVNLGDKYAMNGVSGPSNMAKLGQQLGTGGGHSHDKAARQRIPIDPGTIRPKSLMGIPWRYAIACIDQLGLILRAEIIWAKPNGLPESVTDRVRRSHEQWFHLTRSPRYYSAVDEIREAHSDRRDLNGAKDRNDYQWNRDTSGQTRQWEPKGQREYNPLGKLPGSVWTIPTQPLTVPAELGVDHFAAYPMEFPRRIIQGWTPNGICTACGEGRRPVATPTDDYAAKLIATREYQAGTQNRWGDNNGSQAGFKWHPGQKSGETSQRTITGYMCVCPTPDAPTTPAIVLDPFGGTGTTALVAKALGRIGITIDLSRDYCRLAEWRCNDPRELAAALQVEKPAPVHPDQLDLFTETTA